MFRTASPSIIRSLRLYTQIYVIQVLWLLASKQQFHPDPARKLSANFYDIPMLCVQRKTPDDGQRNCLKYAEFYSNNKFEKLVHLVGFIIGIYYDTRSHERQISYVCLTL